MSDDIVKRLREEPWVAATHYEAADCIERLRAKLAAERELKKKYMRKALERARERDKLREALKPFAKEAEGWSPAWKDRPDPNEHATPWYSYEDEEDRAPTFTIHDLRRARAVLEETGDDNGL